MDVIDTIGTVVKTKILIISWLVELIAVKITNPEIIKIKIEIIALLITISLFLKAFLPVLLDVMYIISYVVLSD